MDIRTGTINSSEIPTFGRKALTFCNQPDHKFYTNCQPVLAVVAPRIPFSTHAEHPLGIPGFGPTAEPQATH
jgi:hypothetical protein